SSSSDVGDVPPWLEELGDSSDEDGESTTVDGGKDNLRCTQEDMESKWRQYPNITIVILATFVRLAFPSRAQQHLLFAWLRNVDEDGVGLTPGDVPSSADHFERSTR
ncbi:unnamed protein product, partial [Ectocarpus sp. 12 AP-2014]